MTERERLVLNPADGDGEIGRWISAFEEVRHDTLQVLREIPAAAVDRDPGDGGDTLGTVLYHMALVEVDWVFSDVLDQQDRIPRGLFPFEDRVEDGHLMPVLASRCRDTSAGWPVRGRSFWMCCG